MPPTPFLVVFSNYVATVIQYVVEQLGDMNLQKEITTWAPSGFLHPISSQLLCQNLPQGWYATNEGPVSVSNLWSMQSFLASLSIVANQLVFFHLVLIPINTKLLKLKSTLWPCGKKQISVLTPWPNSKFPADHLLRQGLIPDCQKLHGSQSRLPSVVFKCLESRELHGAKCKARGANASHQQQIQDSLFTNAHEILFSHSYWGRYVAGECPVWRLTQHLHIANWVSTSQDLFPFFLLLRSSLYILLAVSWDNGWSSCNMSDIFSAKGRHPNTPASRFLPNAMILFCMALLGANSST